AARCGASVPAWLAERFEGLDDDVATRKLIAAAVAAEQVLDLVDRGVTDFHFYTMNPADLVYAICHLLGLRPAGAKAAQLEQTTVGGPHQSPNQPPRTRGAAHSCARRRDGHHDSGAQARRSWLPRFALRRLAARPARQ